MNSNVKKAAVAVLYTLSIVVAIGIGIMNVGNEPEYSGRDSEIPDCNAYAVEIKQCKKLANNKEGCTGYYSVDPEITPPKYTVVNTRTEDYCNNCEFSPSTQIQETPCNEVTPAE